nr:YbfB/YjiJ family MFS transporter [Lentzea kentuckyensis]
MGIGRFVHTPILPLMTAQAGLGAGSAASLAAITAQALPSRHRAASRTPPHRTPAELVE